MEIFTSFLIKGGMATHKNLLDYDILFCLLRVKLFVKNENSSKVLVELLVQFYSNT